jgi:DNA replication protein DnaC
VPPTTFLKPPSARQACKQIRIPTIASKATRLADEAVRSNQGHLAYLDALLEAELADRAERRRHRRIRDARFPRLKRLEDFNFGDAPKIPAALIRELSGCSFVDHSESVIFVGEPETVQHCALPSCR